jgi:hypothetical protein
MHASGMWMDNHPPQPRHYKKKAQACCCSSKLRRPVKTPCDVTHAPPRHTVFACNTHERELIHKNTPCAGFVCTNGLHTGIQNEIKANRSRCGGGVCVSCQSRVTCSNVFIHLIQPDGWMDGCMCDVQVHGVRQPSPKGGEAPPPPTPNLPTPIRSFPGFVRSYITRKEEAEEERKNESE